MDTPNFFDFPAGEVPEGAVVCWLLAWASPQHRAANAGLHGTAVALLRRLLELCRVATARECQTVELRRPYQPAAALVLVNDDLAILLDEKQDARDNPARPQQLLQAVRREFPGRRVAGVLLQVRDQSGAGTAQRAGFACFGRRDCLRLLQHAQGQPLRSDLVGDFHRHLLKIEEATLTYRQTPIGQWGRDRDCWGGFFAVLRERLGDGDWGPITNQGGGLMAFWWHWKGDSYLQLEQDQLCFKIKLKDRDERWARWRDWHQAVMAAAPASGLPVRRPARRRSSTWMTVAFLEMDYRQKDPAGLLDLDGTVALLQRAERLQDAAAAP